MPSRILFALFLAAAALPRVAEACSVCAGGDPLAAASEQPSASRRLRAVLETEWLTVSSGNETVPGAKDVLDQYSVRALAVFSPLDDLNVALTVPFLVKHLVTEGAPSGGHAGHTETGLGDVEIGARWFAINRTDLDAMQRHVLALSVGSSVPTGATGRADAAGEVDEHAQVGTGAFGPYAGLSYRLQASNWSASASLTGRYRTANWRGYRYGEALMWSAGGDWRPIERFALSLGVDGRLAQRDREDDAFVAHTGGLVLLAAPGAHFEVHRNIWLSLRAQLPFFTHLYGVQSVGPTVTGGVQVQLF